MLLWWMSFQPQLEKEKYKFLVIYFALDRSNTMESITYFRQHNHDFFVHYLLYEVILFRGCTLRTNSRCLFDASKITQTEKTTFNYISSRLMDMAMCNVLYSPRTSSWWRIYSDVVLNEFFRLILVNGASENTRHTRHSDTSHDLSTGEFCVVWKMTCVKRNINTSIQLG